MLLKVNNLERKNGAKMTRATAELYLFCAKMVSESRGLLNLKIRREKINNRPFLFCAIIAVYLGHGIFHPVS